MFYIETDCIESEFSELQNVQSIFWGFCLNVGLLNPISNILRNVAILSEFVGNIQNVIVMFKANYRKSVIFGVFSQHIILVIL